LKSAVFGTAGQPADIICLSHLRWDFVFQRPQHLMSRAARDRRVFYLEPPKGSRHPDRYLLKRRARGLSIVVPVLASGMAAATLSRQKEAARMAALRDRVEELIESERISNYVLWYYTPMAVPVTRRLDPVAVVYDCMDELALFKRAPRRLLEYEAELFARADVVFTGGRSLYEAKRSRHRNVHAFPSSVDAGHFARARDPLADPPDQARIPRPRLGYFGVIDERMDMRLVQAVADERPDWSIVLVGPFAKITKRAIPRGPNIHHLGKKAYEELPAYLAGWDVALLPFARNEATRFISPTKTPEYLAAGKPVISTSIRDVVHPYGVQGLVRIADGADEFIAAVEEALAEEPGPRMRRADLLLERLSWDRTWAAMDELLQEAVRRRRLREGALPSVAAAGESAPRVAVPVRAGVVGSEAPGRSVLPATAGAPPLKVVTRSRAGAKD
jgi:glycosyltransferase involved in cell wall biosynthesis